MKDKYFWMKLTRPRTGTLKQNNSYVKLKPGYWKEINKLPNPVQSPSRVGEVVIISIRSLVALIYFPDAVPGTGHSGVWSGHARGGYGHVIVPLDAIQYVSNEDDDKWRRYEYRKFKFVNMKGEYPATALIANLGNYGFSVAQIAEMTGLSRWGVHKKVQRFPWYLRSRILREQPNEYLFEPYCIECGCPTYGSTAARYCPKCRSKRFAKGMEFAKLKRQQISREGKLTRKPNRMTYARSVDLFEHTWDIPGFDIKDFLVDEPS